MDLAFGSILPLTVSVTRVAGDAASGTWRSAEIEVPPVDGAATATGTVTATDGGGTPAQQSFAVAVDRTTDPTAPTIEWLSPWEGGSWPALWTRAGGGGTPLLLRVRVRDLDATAGGTGAGRIARVRLRGPDDSVGTQGSFLEAAVSSGDPTRGEAIFDLPWLVPDGVPAGTRLVFEAEAIDGGGNTVVRSASLQAVRPRYVRSGGAGAVLPGDPMTMLDGDPAGPTFLLDGATLAIYPQADGSLRELPSAQLWAGVVAAASGPPVVHPSVLTAPEPNSSDPTVVPAPLELAVRESFGVGGGCRVDLSGHGARGGHTGAGLPDPGAGAGGTHGGVGRPSGDGHPASPVFDSIRDPRLAGGGGGARIDGPGGSGGGVVRIEAPSADVRIEGIVTADAGPEVVGGAPSGSGGAGGAIAIAARRLDGSGRISAQGAEGGNPCCWGGGGGGRIAIRTVEPPASGLDVEASGGGDYYGYPGSASIRGGAGTIWVARLDETTGEPANDGVLRIENRRLPAGSPRGWATPLPAIGEGLVEAIDPTAGTVRLDLGRINGLVAGALLVLTGVDGVDHPFRVRSQGLEGGGASARVRLAVEDPIGSLPELAGRLASGERISFRGRQRFDAVLLRGRARLVTLDELEVAGSFDDPASIDRDDAASFWLRQDLPALTVTTSEPEGDLTSGHPVDAAWVAVDPLGISQVEAGWSTQSPATVRPDRTVDQLASEAGSLRLDLPESASGQLALAVTATDAAGRTRRVERRWTVHSNEPAIASAALSADSPAEIRPGLAFGVDLSAHDRDGISRLEVRGTASASSRFSCSTSTRRSSTRLSG